MEFGKAELVPASEIHVNSDTGWPTIDGDTSKRLPETDASAWTTFTPEPCRELSSERKKVTPIESRVSACARNGLRPKPISSSRFRFTVDNAPEISTGFAPVILTQVRCLSKALVKGKICKPPI